MLSIVKLNAILLLFLSNSNSTTYGRPGRYGRSAPGTEPPRSHHLHTFVLYHEPPNLILTILKAPRTSSGVHQYRLVGHRSMHTAWTSDRIPSSRPKQQSQGKGKQKAQEPPKSKEVRRLEQIREGLRYATGRERDPKGGCFCQGMFIPVLRPSATSIHSIARMHTLSTYSPICRNCGLILCELQQPRYACPHCTSPILTPEARHALEARVDAQIDETLAQEEEERQHAIEQARAAVGAFPTLSANASGSPLFTSDALAAHPTNQTHKVLSLNSKTKKVTVASYHTAPVVSRPEKAHKGETKPDAKRVPPPPAEVPFVKEHRGSGRPWANLRGGVVTYVPPPKPSAGSSGGQHRKKGKGKAKDVNPEKENAA